VRPCQGEGGPNYLGNRKASVLGSLFDDTKLKGGRNGMVGSGAYRYGGWDSVVVIVSFLYSDSGEDIEVRRRADVA